MATVCKTSVLTFSGLILSLVSTGENTCLDLASTATLLFPEQLSLYSSRTFVGNKIRLHSQRRYANDLFCTPQYVFQLPTSQFFGRYCHAMVLDHWWRQTNPRSRFYIGFTALVRAVIQASAVTSQDRTLVQHEDSQEDTAPVP
ncbi:hypothetical protein M378DRAFT_751097 [Amanita muscaria Koide BX008]|uniref:Secreted protein n=1 Tax=Amanita muscaria (strain Koide BX008) TaxID=946122 RepID=A0A0C2SHI8_AMAMK|nr:hypothetical protein M378DRAFT_751097 [Amanita muscaria Koide BX008]